MNFWIPLSYRRGVPPSKEVILVKLKITDLQAPSLGTAWKPQRKGVGGGRTKPPLTPPTPFHETQLDIHFFKYQKCVFDQYDDSNRISRPSFVCWNSLRVHGALRLILYEFLNFHTPKSGPEMNEIFIFFQTSLRAMNEESLYGRELSVSFQMQPSDPPKIW